ncbi:transposase [Effusibacillus pohliae]|uniref:transposase n=1 Tax=Effusibacillus pohliae TaxID=232270 RepID=UPI000475E729
MDTKTQGVIQVYNPQIAVVSDHHIIVGIQMSNSTSDQKQFEGVLGSIQENMGHMPEKVSADAEYFSAGNIWEAEAANVDAYIAACKEGKQTGNPYDKTNFTYQPETDTYVCPAGKILKLKQTQYADDLTQSTKWVYECKPARSVPFKRTA